MWILRKAECLRRGVVRRQCIDGPEPQRDMAAVRSGSYDAGAAAVNLATISAPATAQRSPAPGLGSGMP